MSPIDLLSIAGGKTFGGVFAFQVAVDPANHTATSAVDTAVTVPTGIQLESDDVIVAIPPAALEAQIAVQRCAYASATSMTLRTANASAGAVDPASGTWTFLVFRS